MAGRTQPPSTSDISVFGARSRFTGVRAEGVAVSPWLRGFAVSGALARRGILHVGVLEAYPPLRVVRWRQTSTYFLACFGGSGRVFVDGRWRVCRAGTACLLPAHIYESFYAQPGPAWEYCWVCYAPERMVASVTSPVMARYQAGPLLHSVQGLREECRGAAAPIAVERWLDSIDDYVRRFAEPWRRDERMAALWETVASRLAEPWPLERLARAAHCSGESLRQKCHDSLGRSPIQHVIYLRMRRATELLVGTDEKVENIARAVGCANAFAFSSTFKQWLGCPPSEYRARHAHMNR